MGWQVITSDRRIELSSDENKDVSIPNLYIGNYKKNPDNITDMSDIGDYYDKENIKFVYEYSNDGNSYSSIGSWVEAFTKLEDTDPVARAVYIAVKENKTLVDRYARIYLKNNIGTFNKFYIYITQKAAPNTVQKPNIVQKWFIIENNLSENTVLLFTTTSVDNEIISYYKGNEVYFYYSDNEYINGAYDYIITNSEFKLPAIPYMVIFNKNIIGSNTPCQYLNLESFKDCTYISIGIQWTEYSGKYIYDTNVSLNDGQVVYINSNAVPATDTNTITGINIITNIYKPDAMSFIHVKEFISDEEYSNALNNKLYVLKGEFIDAPDNNGDQDYGNCMVKFSQGAYIMEAINMSDTTTTGGVHGTQIGTSQDPYVLKWHG